MSFSFLYTSFEGDCRRNNDFKSSYKLVEQIFSRYVIFKSRLEYEDFSISEKNKHWKRYMYEVNWSLECMNIKEKEVLVERFLNKKDIHAMYISSSKYYQLIHIAIEKFLANIELSLLDTAFLNYSFQQTL